MRRAEEELELLKGELKVGQRDIARLEGETEAKNGEISKAQVESARKKKAEFRLCGRPDRWPWSWS